MNNPLLSISILCSGRPETKKCLDSLKTLRKKLPCELILVDTGCTIEKKGLLCAYADRIVPFVWCDDFAKARNAGLETARGEWFMYIDDDEWFLDTQEIEQFFLSGEYKNYRSANYVVRNYLDKEGYTYEDSWAQRLVQRTAQTRFYGIIHEALKPMQIPQKSLSSTAEHYGYIYRTKEEEENHTRRNRTLLLKALSEQEDDIRIWTHLAWQYLADKEYETLRDFCHRALKKFEKNDDFITNIERGCFYCNLLDAYICLKEEKAAKKTYRKAMADKRNTDYCVARLLTFGAEIFEQTGEKEALEECCARYFALWESYQPRPEALVIQETFSVRQAFHQLVRNNMYSRRICLDLEKKDTSSLRKYFDDFAWEDELVYMTERFMPHLVRAMAQLPYEEIFVHAAQVLGNKPGMDNFWEEAGKIEQEEEMERFIRILSEVTGEAAAEAAKKMTARLQTKREMRALAQNVKQQVLLLLSNGMKQEALQIITQLKKLIPDDKELEEMEGKCGR